MRVVVHSAVVQDHDRAGLVLYKLRGRFPARTDVSRWRIQLALRRLARAELTVCNTP